ncbi:MAG TPA: lytic transglycosylase domain-containing protein [Burkholderiaceae bacterium]|nr:lytic transglycosylase domain-containing protein [Burkholderiaceae bacterium]
MAADQDTARPDGGGRRSHAAEMPVPEHWRTHLRSNTEPHRTDAGPAARFVRALANRLAELLNVCAIYLGIAVLVTLALVFTMAPLRSQLGQIHQSLIMALRPANMDDVLFAMLAIDDENLSLLESLSGTAVLPRQAAQRGESPRSAEEIREEAINFARLLKDSARQGRVEGITAAQEDALRKYLARKYRIASSVAGALINAAFVVGREMDLDPQLILAVIAIESRYNPYAESHVGAQGLMQVMTRVHKEKFTEFSDGTIAALHPIANMRVGSRILRDCIDRRGSIERGLACYVGATGPNDGGYGAKVLAEQRRIALASGIPVRR